MGLVFPDSGFFILFLFVVLFNDSSQSPEFRKPVMEYTTIKSVNVTIDLVYSDDSVPRYYATTLESPICMDELCNPIAIEIEWDLLGNFKNYHELKSSPITKFDHEPFEKEDHEKLKKILSNKSSLLQDYRMEDLVDTTQLVYSEEIDGMTGATSKTFANEVVGGAIYTCYTLWHFVNGQLDEKLLHYTEQILDEMVLLEMLQSGKEEYLHYVLDKKKVTFSKKVNKVIGDLIWEGEPVIAVKAVNVVEENYWEDDSIKQVLEDNFSGLETPVHNAIIQQMTKVSITYKTLEFFVKVLPELGDRKRRLVYKIFEAHSDLFDTNLKKELQKIFKGDRFPMGGEEYKLLSGLGISY